MSITVTLPDGSQQEVQQGATPLEIARSISPRMAEDAVVARVNGDLFDLTRPLETDATLQILTSRNPEALEV
ncbi:MAG TPA: TGS domain-containing protein, partial [Bryobacteraceae bacterium]|nr:TGS domain-containing protein [Bryobacteraceae bacterium]